MAINTALRLIHDADVERFASFTVNINLQDPLNDPRFGSAGSMSFDCPQCNASENNCLGHCGMLLLNCKIFHPLVYTRVVKIINEKCIMCNTSHKNKNIHRCHKCNNQLHRDYYINYKQNSYAVVIRSERDTNKRTVIRPEEFLDEIFPAGYVVSRILVSPVSMRTPYDMEHSELYKSYEKIIQVIRSYSRKRHHTVDEYNEYINNVSMRYQKLVGSEGIIGMLGGKTGLFREIMLGKRMNNCARAVIAPDPSIAIDQVAVPRLIAEKVRIQVVATKDNVAEMRGLARRGQLWWREECLVEPRHVVVGMRFRRVLKDGDYALLNRQPSLSRSSLLCFRVRKRADDYYTFGINPQAVCPFNADFDGDEMHIFFGVYCEDTKTELESLCHISCNVVIDGRVEVGPVQDVITGCYMMSQRDSPVSRSVADQCEMYYDKSSVEGYISCHHENKSEIDQSKPSWVDIVKEPTREPTRIATTESSVRLTWAELFRSRTDASRSWADMVEEDEESTGHSLADMVEEDEESTGHSLAEQSVVTEEADQSKEGQVTTYSLLRACIPGYIEGERLTKSRLLSILKDARMPLECLQLLQRVVLIWLSEEGLSVPLSSLTVTSAVPQRQSNVIRYQNKCKEIVETELGNTHVMCMIDSGAKGDVVHLQHMAVSLGQQIVLGKQGVFCRNSYITGLDPDEFFGHQMAAREGVVRTGVGTAESGYLNRKCCKVMSDVRVNLDKTIGDNLIVSTFNNNE